MTIWLLGLLLAAMLFGINFILRRRGDEVLYRRVTRSLAAIIIAIAFALLAAIQLGFIQDHAP